MAIGKYSDEFEKLPEETSRPLAILKAATQAANSMDDILKIVIRKLSRMQCQHLMQHYLRFLTLYLKAGGVWRPKCHLLLHLIPKSNGARQPSTLFYLSRRESQWSHRENREVSTSLHVGQCHTLQMLHSQPEKLGSDRGSRFFECLRLLCWLEKYMSEKLHLQTTTLLSGSHNPSFRVFQGLSGIFEGFFRVFRVRVSGFKNLKLKPETLNRLKRAQA